MNAIINESASIRYTISKWTARVAKQVNKHAHLFSLLLPMTTTKGPKKSNPILVNAGLNGSTRGFGKDAIIGGACFARCILKLTHFFTIRLMALLRFSGQYFDLTSAKVLSTPACAVLQWASMTSQLVKQ